MKLMEGEHVGPFNLGNPGEFTMLELAQVSSLLPHSHIYTPKLIYSLLTFKIFRFNPFFGTFTHQP